MFRKLFVLIALFAVASSHERAAVAHPHLWIDAAGTIQFDQGKIVAIRFQWTFDEFFSAGVIGEFDKNANKKFDDDEIEPLRAGAFEGTREVGFFTDIRIAGEKFPIQTTRDFKPRIEKDAAIYEFTVPFVEPFDPTQKELTISVYDDSYFVDIGFQGHDPIKLKGDGSATCAIRMTEDRDNPIYGGVVYPKKASLQCSAR
jgi:ABC-type uncharacterized transport system substrate-binding protein